MSVVEYTLSYNPHNPKCRYCKYYEFNGTQWLFGNCINKYFKGNKNRDHNSKACLDFTYSDLQTRVDNKIKKD